MKTIHQTIVWFLTVMFLSVGSAATEAREYWGAYVYSNWDDTVFGLSWNYSSPQEAAQAALRECQRRASVRCDMLEVFSSSAVHDSPSLSRFLRNTFPDMESNHVTKARCVWVR